MSEELEKELEKYHHFSTATAKLKDVLALVRSGAYSNYDEGGEDIVICPECEEWTHVRFNSHSCLLDLLGELIVENISVHDGCLEVWIKTDEFNWFCDDGGAKDG
jgi:hypothetical protein